MEPKRLTTEQYCALDHTYDWPEKSRQWMAVKHECQEANERAVVFNLSSVAEFLLEGKNALQVMESLSPTDLKSMTNNSSIVTYLLNRRGGIDADVVVHKVNDNEFYMTCADLNTNQVLSKIQNVICDQFIETTKVIDLSQRIAVLSVNGPKSTQVLENCLNISLKDFEDRTHHQIKVNVSSLSSYYN